jgi:hypothetical protein
MSNPTLDDREHELVLLLCGTSRRRSASHDRIAELCATVDFGRLLGRLRHQRVLVLAGTRLLASHPSLVPVSFEATVQAARGRAGRDARVLDAVGADLLRRLEQERIPAMPLKGPWLARRLYGDPALRPCEDVDLLVGPQHLAAATELVCAQGWDRVAEPGHDGVPWLHRHLVAPSPWLPTVELHWRVHWYERTFSPAMLERASITESGRMAAASDELASLLLFFARDGFLGLRLGADIAAWWDAHAHELAPRAMAALVTEHRELERSLTTAATVAGQVVGLPIERLFTGSPRLGHRARRAAQLANWNQRGDPDQVSANVTLVDGLLAPPGGLPDFARRHLLTPAEAIGDHHRVTDGFRRRVSAALHAAKLAARYVIALWLTRGGRAWAALPRSPSRTSTRRCRRSLRRSV